MKWIKRLLMFVACLLAMLIVFSAGSYYMLKREPEWALRPPMTAQMQEEAIARAQTQFARVEDLATSLRAYEARREKAIRDGTTLPSDELPKPVTVQLSEDELNAVYQKFAASRGWDKDLQGYLSEPKIILQKDHLILGGRLSEAQVVASAYFKASIDQDGQFKLDLVRVLGGQLPLPDVMFDKYRQKVVGTLQRRLPFLQNAAKIDKKGIPNDSTVQASMTKLLLQSIQHQPSDPFFFLPLLTAKGTVPVRLTDVQITGEHIQMTIAPMSEPDRVSMLAKLKEPYRQP